MIRIARPPEPEELTRERHRRLAKVFLKWRDKSTPRRWTSEEQSLFDKGYRKGSRSELAEAQHHKCAFCEKKLGVTDPVDHFRPRRGKQDVDGHDGYWWLTWTWENLLCICHDCSSFKGSSFPLAPGSLRLQSEELPPGGERPHFIDPTVQTPRDHIRFEYVVKRERWEPVGQTPAGEFTISELHLADRCLEQYTSHLAAVESEDRELWEVRRDLERGEHSEAIARWNRVTRNLLSESQLFRSLMYDYLAHWRGQIRHTMNIDLPEVPPLAQPTSSPSPPMAHFKLPPLFAQYDLSEELQLKILALGKRAEPEALKEVLVDLTRLRDWSVTELAQLLERTVRTVQTYATELDASGRVRYERQTRLLRCAKP